MQRNLFRIFRNTGNGKSGGKPNRPVSRDVFDGVLLGCAVADGIGYRLQLGASVHSIVPGEWTDDSSLAFLSAECRRDPAKSM
jgi:hypothetical protein